MDDIIKSAREIAMEKVEKLGEATDQERLRWQYVPEGEKLGVSYLKQPDINLLAELDRYKEGLREYVVEGASDVLARNIGLPVNDLARKNNRRAMDGLKALKSDKVAVENVFSRMRNIFKHYAEQGEQQRKQAYQSLKAEFEAKVRQALQQQLGSFAGVRIDVERQPQFHEEWRRLQAQMDAQYLTLLDEYKRELSGLA